MTISNSLAIPLEHTVVAGMIALARISGVLTIAPFIGSAAVPVRLKVGMAIFLTFFLTPLVMAMPLGTIAVGSSMSRLLSVMPGELAVGFLIGLSLQLIFEAGRIAGQICGVQMGYSLASVVNPDNSQADSAALSTFYELIVLLLFIQLGVTQWLLRALARSFAYLPPGQFSLSWPSMRAALDFSAGIWVTGLQIAAPVLVASLFADVALGFLGKASPQLPVLFMGISIKNLIGLVLLCGAVASWPRLFEGRFAAALDASEKILQLAH